jgi:hypothetical protein
MRVILYNYYLPFRNICGDDETIEKYSDFKAFRKEWDKDEECIIILPVNVFDLIGLDIRMIFREYGRNDDKKFLLIGDRKQIEFALSQNDKFLQNTIQEINLPIYANSIEDLIYDKLADLEEYIKRK